MIFTFQILDSLHSGDNEELSSIHSTLKLPPNHRDQIKNNIQSKPDERALAYENNRYSQDVVDIKFCKS